jgi:hypothetical protein
MDSQSLYSVVAHNRFIEELTDKAPFAKPVAKPVDPLMVAWETSKEMGRLQMIQNGSSAA